MLCPQQYPCRLTHVSSSVLISLLPQERNEMTKYVLTLAILLRNHIARKNTDFHFYHHAITQSSDKIQSVSLLEIACSSYRWLSNPSLRRHMGVRKYQITWKPTVLEQFVKGFSKESPNLRINEPLTRYVKLRVAHARECRERFPPPPISKETASQRSRHASRHVRHARAVMYVGIAYPQWRGKLSRHSRRMRNP